MPNDNRKLVKMTVEQHQRDIQRAQSQLNLALFAAAHQYPDATFGVDVNRSDQHNIVEIVVRMRRVASPEELAAEDEARAAKNAEHERELNADRLAAVKHQAALDEAKGVEPDFVKMLTEEWNNSPKGMPLKEYLAMRQKQREEEINNAFGENKP